MVPSAESIHVNQIESLPIYVSLGIPLVGFPFLLFMFKSSIRLKSEVAITLKKVYNLLRLTTL